MHVSCYITGPKPGGPQAKHNPGRAGRAKVFLGPGWALGRAQMTWLKIGPGSGMSKFEPWPARDRPGPSLPQIPQLPQFHVRLMTVSTQNFPPRKK